MHIHLSEPVKIGIDVGAGGVTVLSLFNTIPKITAILSLLWVCVRLYETDTIQRLIQTLNAKRKRDE